ncbi:Uncharacterized protein Rs2_06701 [Raphanus sativus]|nr:Uncharacterized protein Rs2_06701 [Raphanus sativus]
MNRPTHEDHSELLRCVVVAYGMVKRLKSLMVRTYLLFICFDVTWCWIGWSKKHKWQGVSLRSEAERNLGRKRQRQNKGKRGLDLLTKQLKARRNEAKSEMV